MRKEGVEGYNDWNDRSRHNSECPQTIVGHGVEALRVDMKSAGVQGDTKNVTTNTSANTGRNLCILGRSWDL